MYICFGSKNGPPLIFFFKNSFSLDGDGFPQINEGGNYLNEVSSHQGGAPCSAGLAVHIHRALAGLLLV